MLTCLEVNRHLPGSCIAVCSALALREVKKKSLKRHECGKRTRRGAPMLHVGVGGGVRDGMQSFSLLLFGYGGSVREVVRLVRTHVSQKKKMEK